MKRPANSPWKISALLVTMTLISGCQTEPVRSTASVPVTNVIMPPPSEPVTAPPPVARDPMPTRETLQSIALPKTPVKLSPGVEEIAKLLRAGVHPEVIVNYVRNAPMQYELSANEIVYLSDLGADEVVLSELMGTSQFAPPQVSQPSTAVETTTIVLPDPQATRESVPSTEMPEIAPGTPGVSPPSAEADPNAGLEPSDPNSNYVVVESAAPGETEPAQTTIVVEQAPTTVVVKSGPAQEVVSEDYFYEALSPYGDWIDVPDYGYCWQPTVAVVDYSWRPYGHRGRWLYTDYGWYWNSYYSWGHIPFHYGRWTRHHHLGWIWAPDTVWGPAWVTWRHHDNYVGWAPLPPRAVYHAGIGIHFGGRYVGHGFGFHIGFSDYSFVDYGHFYHHHPYRYYAGYGKSKDIYHKSTINNNYIVGDNNTIINGGVNITKIEQAGRIQVPKLVVRDENSQTSTRIAPARVDLAQNTLSVSRPQIATPSRRPSPNAATARYEERKNLVASNRSSANTRIEPQIQRTTASTSRNPSVRTAANTAGSASVAPRQARPNTSRGTLLPSNARITPRTSGNGASTTRQTPSLNRAPITRTGASDVNSQRIAPSTRINAPNPSSTAVTSRSPSTRNPSVRPTPSSSTRISPSRTNPQRSVTTPSRQAPATRSSSGSSAIRQTPTTIRPQSRSTAPQSTPQRPTIVRSAGSQQRSGNSYLRSESTIRVAPSAAPSYSSRNPIRVTPSIRGNINRRSVAPPPQPRSSPRVSSPRPMPSTRTYSVPRSSSRSSRSITPSIPSSSGQTRVNSVRTPSTRSYSAPTRSTPSTRVSPSTRSASPSRSTPSRRSPSPR